MHACTMDMAHVTRRGQRRTLLYTAACATQTDLAEIKPAAAKGDILNNTMRMWYTSRHVLMKSLYFTFDCDGS